MLAEFLDRLKTLAQDAITAKHAADFPEIANLPDKYLMKVGRDGRHELITLPALGRRPKLRRLADIGPFVAFLADRCPDSRPSIWLDNERVTIIFHDPGTGWMEDRATIALNMTTPFQTLLEFDDEPRGFDHRDFIRFLRIELAAYIPGARELLNTLKTIRFENGIAINSTNERSRESVGREITAAIRAEAAEIPEAITVNVPVFNDPDLNDAAPIPCLIDLNPKNAEFRLIPLAETTREAIDAALARARKIIAAAVPTVPLFSGTP